jgi:conjugal transfer pilus assembly protein TraU
MKSTNRLKNIVGFTAFLFGCGFFIPAHAISTTKAASAVAACSSAGSLSNTMTNSFCMDSMFPIRVMGSDMGTASDAVGSPPGAAVSSVCQCSEYVTGTPTGMWVPDRLIETVRQPGCSPVYGSGTGGAALRALVSSLDIGMGTDSIYGGGTGKQAAAAGFRHYNSWDLGLARTLNLPVAACVPQADLETSVTSVIWWSSDPTLQNLLYPEWIELSALDSVIGLLVEAASCIVASAPFGLGDPARAFDDFLYWQAGCWGLVLPATGHFTGRGSIDNSAGTAYKSTVASNRNGGYGMFHTIGDIAAACGPYPVPYPQKSGFKHSMVFPVSESSSNTGANTGVMSGAASAAISSLGMVDEFNQMMSTCAHRIGASTLKWGTARTIPTEGEDQAYIGWRWVDCCY